VDASEGEVFIAVYHNENFTNLYISDETGIYYSLTLEDVITNNEVDWESGNGVFDVHVVSLILYKYFNIWVCTQETIMVKAQKLKKNHCVVELSAVNGHFNLSLTFVNKQYLLKIKLLVPEDMVIISSKSIQRPLSYVSA